MQHPSHQLKPHTHKYLQQFFPFLTFSQTTIFSCFFAGNVISSSRQTVVIVADGETHSVSVMDDESCNSGQGISNTISAVPVPSSASHSSPAQSTQPIKKLSSTEEAAPPKRKTSMKFSVTDTCLKKNMEFRTREHELEMEIKRIDKEYKKLKMELLKEKLEMQKTKKEKEKQELDTAVAERQLVEIRKEKERNEINAALAVMKAANVVAQHFQGLGNRNLRGERRIGTSISVNQ